VHRDLKPENILITPDGVVKLTDLGLARAFADARATHAGAVTGTVQYLAPEQIRGEPADPRSDLYSLGIVTYELLTGRLPFEGETPMAIAYKHLSDAVPAPSTSVDLPPELDAFVAAAVDKDREMRPESAAVMRHDLEAIVPSLPRARSLGSVVQDLPEVERATEPTIADVATVTETIPRVDRVRRRRGKRFVGAFLVLAMLVAAAWGIWTYVIPHTTAVPPVTGQPLAEARDRLTSLGFRVTIADGRHDRQVPEGDVLAMDPAAGTELEHGAGVTLIPSLGPPPEPLPEIVGLDRTEAEAQLRDRGFEVEVRKAFHPTAPIGEVIRQQPTGAQAPFGSTVTITVSKGHAPVAIPKVIGDGQKQAEKALRDAGFDVAVVQAFSDDVERGRVMDVSPPEGEEAEFASSVTITVSQGPESFAAPTFTGLSPAAAERRAASYGLNVSFFRVPGTPMTVVISQQPGPGTTVHYGDTITLFVA
jgi:serine/threonine-protein kinase